jgi:2-(1,2-epoxy-1,2-dihydrophenyl)acetyl-CoA isomerase
MHMREADIDFAISQGIATITLDNPAKLNALKPEHYHRLRSLLAQVKADSSIQALILTGKGKAFCVGADLDALSSADGDAAQSIGARTADLMRSATNPLIQDMQELPVPILACVNGVVAGAGVGIALAADLVISARSAFFYLPFAPRLGIIPDLGATWFLPRLAGKARALGMTLLGHRVPAEQAAAWGMIWSCVDDDALVAQASVLGRQLADLPPGIALEARRAFLAADANGLAAQLDLERERQSVLLDTPSFAEGAAAFIEKRAPRFR